MYSPKTEAELAEIVASANGPLSVRGGNTRGMAGRGTPLDLSGLSGIETYEPGALTLVVRAGTPLEQVEAALAAEGQRLAFEPADYRGLLGTDGTPTIGGVFAAGISGPRRIAVGAARDFALGVRFVDGTGRVVKNGGRVMKNVTGYDLVKLQCGARGSLGVLTEIALKVLPVPETAASVMLLGQSPEGAVQAMARALGSPFEVTGAAYSPCGLDGTPVTALRVEGFAGSVSYRAAQLAGLFPEAEVQVEDYPAKVAAGWAMIRDCKTLQGVEGDIWRLSVKPSDAPAVLQSLAPQHYLLDWAGGLIWAAVPAGTDVRAAMHVPGHATRVRGAGPGPQVHPADAGVARLEAGLRAQFDPRGLFSAQLTEV
ncbi:MAG: FAD-binding protein [Pseudomonadota bacterium]